MIQVSLSEGGAYGRVFRNLVYAAMTPSLGMSVFLTSVIDPFPPNPAVGADCGHSPSREPSQLCAVNWTIPRPARLSSQIAATAHANRRLVGVSSPFTGSSGDETSRLVVHSVANEFGPTSKRLLAAWIDLPKHELVPHRHSFDPMAVIPILPVLTILQRGDDQAWRFRLAGSEIDRRWGGKVTGLDFTKLVAPPVVPIMKHEFDEIVRTPCGSWSVAHVEFNSGWQTAIEFLRLPLRAKDGSVSLILGCAAELPSKIIHLPELPLSLRAIVQQKFFDIGGGTPTSSSNPVSAV
jgi:hypothetical protein